MFQYTRRPFAARWNQPEGETRPFALVDLEDRLVKESPGIRRILFDGAFTAELRRSIDLRFGRPPLAR